jgi:hypothetical protein
LTLNHFILRIGSICVLLTASVQAQKETFVPASDVSFKISTDHKTHRAGDKIILKYRITNISNASLYVPREWEVTCPASPHVWAWFENSSGQHFVPGFGGECSPSGAPKSVSERMAKEAVLLKPGEHLDGTFRLDTTLFGGLKPGPYRIETTLTGWRDERFTPAELSELAQMGSPFMRGEIPDSMRTTLVP